MSLREIQQPLKDRYREDPSVSGDEELEKLLARTERYCTVLQTLRQPPRIETTT
ncbi:MAG: hypothetical protein AABM29_04815 [Actinomycetota bacterium]